VMMMQWACCLLPFHLLLFRLLCHSKARCSERWGTKLCSRILQEDLWGRV